jgi:FAD/FMN-containing dehydrogenase/Fe-S oxidoreductase
MEAFKNALEDGFEGEVRFDRASRVLYSTDASLYQIEPLGVVIPRHPEDVQTCIRLGNEYKVPVLPRGGGTGLAGQSVGRAVVMDMSKYMNRILELNEEEGWVKVEPGVVLDELNAYLNPYGLQFAPDVATSSRANIGGMIANNSAGAHSIIYGKTIDHVLELEVILSDGSKVLFRDLDPSELRHKIEQKDLEGQIYREVIRLAGIHKDEIERRYPKVLRRVGGYNLDEFVKQQPFNMARMIVGSEGTLAAIVGAKIKVIPLPKAKVLGVVQFNGLIEAMKAVAPILCTGPAAVELIDKMILDETKSSIALASQRGWVEGDPEAVLVVEYYGESTEELTSKLVDLENLLGQKQLGFGFRRAISTKEQGNVWNIRKAGLGLLMGIKGDSKPVAFVEDSAVPPERLPEYVEEFDGIVRKHNTTAGYYAHASVGLLHIRPLINLKTSSGVQKMISIAEEVRDLVLKYGGAMSGEHGDGLVRSCWNEKMFGSRLYGAFREIKAAFDPSGLMNPGKIVDAPLMTENLRFGPTYVAEEIKTHFDFSADGGFHRAVEMCNGVGACRKKSEGTMCPTYMATLEEEHSTRGRANALRAAVSGVWEGGLTDDRLFEVLDLCLECKACKAECPSNVDMAKIKYEFLAQYYQANGRPLRAWLFGNIELLNRVGCALHPISNWMAGSGLTRFALSLLGISAERTLPPFARETFVEWFGKRKGLKSEKKVVLFSDTYMTYNYPEIGIAATGVLETAGIEVLLAEKKCCGRPFLSSGMMEEAKASIQFNTDSLHKYVELGYDIVGFEPSCVSMLKDDSPELTKDPRAKTVAENCYAIETYISRLAQAGNLSLSFSGLEKQILLHGHCHQKALWGVQDTLEMLNLPPGYDATLIDSGCCGMAGAFGYESEHYEFSLQVGEARLLSHIREAGGEVEIAAAGISCREQIQHATQKTPRHPVEILWDALR